MYQKRFEMPNAVMKLLAYDGWPLIIHHYPLPLHAIFIIHLPHPDTPAFRVYQCLFSFGERNESPHGG
jgi:hypothetical protein